MLRYSGGDLDFTIQRWIVQGKGGAARALCSRNRKHRLYVMRQPVGIIAEYRRFQTLPAFVACQEFKLKCSFIYFPF